MTPVVGHLVGQAVVPCQLVEEMLRIGVPTVSMLVDLFDVEGAVRSVKVPDLEVNGVHCAFAEVVLERHLVGIGVVGPRCTRRGVRGGCVAAEEVQACVPGNDEARLMVVPV